jgi:Mg-chelatase subunit ChlI
VALLLLFISSGASAALAQSTNRPQQINAPIEPETVGKTIKTAKKKTARRWLTRKKILIAVLAGCLIATAIAVPVAVHAHVQHDHHVAYQKAVSNLIARNDGTIRSQISADLQREQGIQNLLNQGNLTPAQTANLQSQLSALQTNVSILQREENLIMPLAQENYEAVLAAFR